MLIIDFETFYDVATKYSLKNMSTPQYLRDPRFQILGVALASDREFLGESAARYFHWDAVDTGDSDATGEAALTGVQEMIAQGDLIICHNAGFDLSILWWACGIKVPPPQIRDTMLLARLAISQGLISPDLTTSLAVLSKLTGVEKGDMPPQRDAEATAAYAVKDVEATKALYHHLMDVLEKGMDPSALADELEYMSAHVAMMAYPGFNLDEKLLADTYANEMIEFDRLPVIRNDASFAALLAAQGVYLPSKPVKSGGEKLMTSKDDGVIPKLLADPNVNEEAKRLLNLRLAAASPLIRTRTRRYLDVGSPLPVPILYYGCHTGRGSGLEAMNPQNLNRGGALRRSLIPPNGHTIVRVDSSQIEVRVLAWLANCKPLMRLLEGDVYTGFASEYLYRLPIEQIDKPKRQLSKNVVLGLGYGMSSNGFTGYCKSRGVEVDPSWSDHCVNTYRSAFSEIPRLWNIFKRMVVRDCTFSLPSGRKLIYPGLNSVSLEFKKPEIFKREANRSSRLWHGTIIENIVQAVARDLVFWQSMILARKWRLVLMAHDESVFIVPRASTIDCMLDCADAFTEIPGWAMAGPAPWLGVGEDYRTVEIGDLSVKGGVAAGDTYAGPWFELDADARLVEIRN